MTRTTTAIIFALFTTPAAAQCYGTVPGIPYTNCQTPMPQPYMPSFTAPVYNPPPVQPLFNNGVGGLRNYNGSIQIQPNCSMYGGCR